MSDRRLLQWDLVVAPHKWTMPRRADGKQLYNVTGWEGSHRGSLLLTDEEASFIAARLTSTTEHLVSLEEDA